MKEREREIKYFSYSLFLLRILFPSVHSVCSHWEQKTNEIIPRISEQQISQGLLWNQNWQVMDTCNSTHITGTEATTNNVFVSLTLPRQAQFIESMWTAPDWVGHCTRQGSKGKDRPCVPFIIPCNFENPTHYIPITAHKIFYTPKKYYPTALQFYPTLFGDLLTCSLYTCGNLRSQGKTACSCSMPIYWELSFPFPVICVQNFQSGPLKSQSWGQISMWLTGPSWLHGSQLWDTCSYQWSRGHHKWQFCCTLHNPERPCAHLVYVNSTCLDSTLYTTWPHGRWPA